MADNSDRTHAMLSLAVTLPKVTRRTLGRHGLAEGGLVTDWAAVVGATIAERSLPLRLSFTGGELGADHRGPLREQMRFAEPAFAQRAAGDARQLLTHCAHLVAPLAVLAD